MQTDIVKTNGTYVAEAASDLDRFTARINQTPAQSELRKDPKGFDYLPASFIQMEMDEIFLGLWSWEVKSIQVVANEILVHGDLKYFHPVSGQWITRSGVGAAIIRQVKDASITDIDKKIKDAITMDLPHAETDAFKNAAKKIGKRFGRDLNRKFTDEYQEQVESLEQQRAREEAEGIAHLIVEVRAAITAYEGSDKEDIRTMLSEKKKHGELTADLLRNTLAALKSVPA